MSDKTGKGPNVPDDQAESEADKAARSLELALSELLGDFDQPNTNGPLLSPAGDPAPGDPAMGEPEPVDVPEVASPVVHRPEETTVAPDIELPLSALTGGDLESETPPVVPWIERREGAEAQTPSVSPEPPASAAQEPSASLDLDPIDLDPNELLAGLDDAGLLEADPPADADAETDAPAEPEIELDLDDLIGEQLADLGASEVEAEAATTHDPEEASPSDSAALPEDAATAHQQDQDANALLEAVKSQDAQVEEAVTDIDLALEDLTAGLEIALEPENLASPVGEIEIDAKRGIESNSEEEVSAGEVVTPSLEGPSLRTSPLLKLDETEFPDVEEADLRSSEPEGSAQSIDIEALISAEELLTDVAASTETQQMTALGDALDIGAADPIAEPEAVAEADAEMDVASEPAETDLSADPEPDADEAEAFGQPETVLSEVALAAVATAALAKASETANEAEDSTSDKSASSLVGQSGERLEIRVPDDWHLHVRDGELLSAVVPSSAEVFGRAIIMPNLSPPVVTRSQALAYRNRIRAAVPEQAEFTPLMTLYLTENTDPDDLARGFLAGDVVAAKLYPAGATTNSDRGVRNVKAIDPVLARMADIGMPLLVHGEVTNPDVDIFDREAVFIEEVLKPLRKRHPELRVIMEHITTREGVEYVRAADEPTAATITVHHLMINRNALFKGGIRPHYFCLPIAKREVHRLALVEAAVSGDERFFLGTDSAPHLATDKESPCGCAGIFTAPVAMGCLAQVFEDEGRLDRLEGFVSLNGAKFYGMEPNERRCSLVRSDDPIELPSHVDIVPRRKVEIFDPERPIHWRVIPAEVETFDFDFDLGALASQS